MPAALAISFVLLFSLAVSASRADHVTPPPSAPEANQLKMDDPLLQPVPPAARQLHTWAEAHALLMQNSTSDRSALAAVESAQGRWRQALGVLLPNASTSLIVAYDALHPNIALLGAAGVSGAAIGTQLPSVPLLAANVGVSQSVVNASAWMGLASAKANRESTAAQLDDGRRRLTQGLAQALIAVVAAERVAELNRVGLRQALERGGLIERMRQLGAGTQIDVVRTRQDVHAARGALIAGDEQLLRTREALALALGIPQGVGVARDFALDGLVQEVAGRCAQVSWEQRSDLAAARATLESARKGTQQAQAGYAPTLGVSSNIIGFTGQPTSARLATWNLLAVLSLPLWEGGSREGLVSERSGLERQAEEALEATRRTVRLQGEQAHRAVTVSEALVAAAADSRASAAQLDLLLRRSFEVGRGSSLELVQSAVQLRQADVVLATREFELVQARLDALLTEARCNW